MSKASMDEGETRRSIVPFVAYAIVLGLVVWVAINLWSWRASGPAYLRDGAPTAPASSPAQPVQPAPAPAINHAASGPELADKGTAKDKPAPEQAASPAASQTMAAATNPAPDPPAAKEPEPRQSKCPIDVGLWPTDRTDQGKAIQVLLQVLGYYSGTTYGTVGPMTRAAIRKFQVAMGVAETGEPSEVLFDLLKRKCDSPTP